MAKILDVIAPDIGSQCTWWRVSKWIAQEGENVTPCQTLAELENDEMTCMLESFDSGIFQNPVKEGAKVQAGEKIAEIYFCREDQEARLDKNFAVTITLTGRQLQELDKYRCEQSRESVASSLVIRALKQIGEQDGAE